MADETLYKNRDERIIDSRDISAWTACEDADVLSHMYPYSSPQPFDPATVPNNHICVQQSFSASGQLAQVITQGNNTTNANLTSYPILSMPLPSRTREQCCADIRLNAPTIVNLTSQGKIVYAEASYVTGYVRIDRLPSDDWNDERGIQILFWPDCKSTEDVKRTVNEWMTDNLPSKTV